jgi:hypothetical protein
MGAAADPREAVTSIARTVQTQLSEVAVEKELPIRELRGPRAEGRFVSATDRTVETPTADNYRFVDQGAVVTGRFLVSFTLLTNDPDGPSRASAREIVASATHVLPGPPWRNPDGTIAMAFPGKSWRVRIALPGFDVEPLAPKQSEPGVRMLARNAKSGVIVSAYLERSPEGWTAVRHREDALVKMQAGDGMKRDKVRRFERADAAILEYEVAAYRGERIDQKSMNAYLVRDGVWIDVHVSKTAFKPEDQPLLDAVIDSVRIEE